MAYYMVSRKQVTGTAFTIAVVTAVCTFFVITLLNYFDLPDVYVSLDTGKCIKVVNYKNGDAFTCQDKDVTLRKFNVIKVPGAAPEPTAIR